MNFLERKTNLESSSVLFDVLERFFSNKPARKKLAAAAAAVTRQVANNNEQTIKSFET